MSEATKQNEVKGEPVAADDFEVLCRHRHRRAIGYHELPNGNDDCPLCALVQASNEVLPLLQWMGHESSKRGDREAVERIGRTQDALSSALALAGDQP